MLKMWSLGKEGQDVNDQVQERRKMIQRSLWQGKGQLYFIKMVSLKETAILRPDVIKEKVKAVEPQ